MLTFLRYLLAAPLLVAGCAGVPIGCQLLSVYTLRRWRDTPFDVGAELADRLTEYDGFWPIPLALLLLVVMWRTTTMWPRIALVPSGCIAVGGLITAGFNELLSTVAALAAPLVAWTLAWLAARVVSWPVTGDVRRSPAEVAVRLRGGGRLRVQSRRLVLDKLPAPVHPAATVNRVALRFDRISHVEVGAVRAPAVWRFANISELTLTPGPVLRVIGGGQEWLLPCDDADEVRRLVTERAAVRAKPEPRPPLESKRWNMAKPLWNLDGDPPQRNTQKVQSGQHWLLVMSALTTLMALFSVYRVFTDGWGYLIGVLLFGGIGYGTASAWWTFVTSQRLAEENPRSPLADDPDSRHLPVTGWSSEPIILGQTSDM
ncbi:hypothetical protein [Nocardia sp. NRRL S-836]|uniref:hypothetical protein n=1 Tax=Nocardia sp. NRRL S-836 TaxID=1519492 RepID=UPI0006AF4D54|nr:hypothetical protein [Nocardia sp. NRRL S-836]KOV79010.1 hypothetical protein ADL03_38640 [Nocardia sp. NRRL S-836]